MKTPKLRKPEMLVIGWMEYVDLPDLGLFQIKAKIDTGARTSAIHATHIAPFQKDGVEWVRFQAQLTETAPWAWVECPIHDNRAIKNTSGVPEDRFIIRTTLRLNGSAWPISVSLTDRSNMRFPMIVGRTALKKRNIAVHTRRAYLTLHDAQLRR